jgi:hypothetical protein
MDYEAIAASVEVKVQKAAGRTVAKKIKNPLKSPEVENIVLPEDVARIQAEVRSAAQKEFFPLDHPKYQGIATAKGYGQKHARIKRTHYSHEAMVDVLIAEPTIKQSELAARFEKSEPWISRILGSDAFQAALAKRREEITDPFLIATIEERFKGLAYQSLDIIAEKLETTKNTDLALKALDVSVKALGFGARAPGTSQNNQFIIQLPPKAANASEWAAEHRPMKQLPGG